MTTHSILAAISSVLVLTACTQNFSEANPRVTATVPVNSTFKSYELDWIGDPIPAYTLKWALTEMNNEMSVCGAVHFRNNDTRIASRNLIQRTEVQINEVSILKDLRFFNRVQHKKDLETATANCVATGVKEPSGRYNYGLFWDRGRVRN